MGWSENIPAEEGLCYAYVDSGEEIPTRVVFVPGHDTSYSAAWRWSHTGDADSFSYRVNGGEWITAVADELKAETSVDVGKLNVFEIYATVNGIDSETVSFGILPLAKEKTEKYFSTRLSSTPYSLATYDFYKGHLLKDAIYLSRTRYGASMDLDVGYSINNTVRPYLGLGYSVERKGVTIIPNAFNVYYAKAVGGVDVKFMKKNDFSLSAGTFGGVMLHVNGNKFNISSVLGARIDFAYSISDNLSVSVGTKASASHLPAAEPLLSSITYLIDPLTLSIEARF